MFWRLTLREIGAVLGGATQRLTREHNDRAWLAWHTAFLNAYAPEKSRKFWKLKDLLHGAGQKPKRRQTVEEQIAIAQAWTAALTRH